MHAKALPDATMEPHPQTLERASARSSSAPERIINSACGDAVMGRERA